MEDEPSVKWIGKGFGAMYNDRKSYAKWYNNRRVDEVTVGEIRCRSWVEPDGEPCLEVGFVPENDTILFVGEEEILALQNSSWGVLNKMHQLRKEPDEADEAEKRLEAKNDKKTENDPRGEKTDRKV